MKFLLVAMILLISACQADEQPSEPLVCEPLSHPDGMVIGGTGTGLALLQRLANAWRMAQPAQTPPITVLPSLGTSGGLRALRERQIDVAIIARPLKDAERAEGLIATPIVRAPLVFATRRPAPARNITSADLDRWYSDPGARWPDRSRVTVLFRETGDGGLKVIKDAAPALGVALDHDPRSSGLGVLLQTDQEMRDALLDIQGSIGWIDLGTIRLEELPLEPLSLDGVSPTPEALAAGRYKLAVSLWLVRRADAPPNIEALIRFASSPAMRTIWATHGYLIASQEQ